MSEYTSRANEAVKAVLIEIGQVLASYKDALVLVGGIVPGLLLPDADPPHLGTIDIDLMLNPEKLEDRYATVVKLLQDAGYNLNEPDPTTFQLYKDVTVDDGPAIRIVVDLLRPAGKLKKRKSKLVRDLRVQEINEGRVALEHFQTITIEGYDPIKRPNKVELQITTLPGLLVLKGDALNSRGKDKDAYDIYYAVRNYPGGPVILAEACQPLLKEFKTSFEHIAQRWKTYDDYGPMTVRQFLEVYPDMGDLRGEELQRDAFEQVRAWLDALGNL